MKKRPLAVVIISCIYIVMGIVGFFYHITDFKTQPLFQFDVIGVEAIRLLALVAGIFMLMGRDWARWLAIAWIALHVIISIQHPWPELVMHIVFFLAITYFLLRPEAREYFRGPKVSTGS